MKELEITVRVRNNRLKERRDALGMSQHALADAAAVSRAAYQQLEVLRRSPKVDGEWSAVARTLANFHCVEPEELFPPVVLAVENPVAVRHLDGPECALIGSHSQTLALGPGDDLDLRERRAQMERAFKTLSTREAAVLRLNFGLDNDGREHTRDEIGERLGIWPSSVGQIKARALHKLQRLR